MSTLQTTPFNQAHQQANAKLVDFSGWQLPINYGSQIAEHEAVRHDAGMFDVSHMLISDIEGTRAKEWLQKLLANDVAKLSFVGKALYSAMLNEQGGVIDDLIVYRFNEAETRYRIVSNGATRTKDLAQFSQIGAEFGVNIQPRYDLCMLAVQGPKAIEKLLQIKPEWANQVTALKPFQGVDLGQDWFVARTGYTGEDGVEIMLPETAANELFNALKNVGVQPCGLGARDTLRLEAGMNLYGHDMTDEISPLQAGMAWTVDLSNENQNFIGKKPLMALKNQGVDVKQVGLLLETRGVLREGMEVITPQGKGIITSGTFSPTLKQSIALARIPVAAENTAQVDIRGTLTDVRILKLPFVRHGKKQFD